MNSIPELRRIIAATRNQIPACNQPKYDIEADDFLGHMAHDFISNGAITKKLYNRLTLTMWARIKIHQSVNTSYAPPLLIRLEGESSKNHIERCYKAGDYHNL